MAVEACSFRELHMPFPGKPCVPMVSCDQDGLILGCDIEINANNAGG